MELSHVTLMVPIEWKLRVTMGNTSERSFQFSCLNTQVGWGFSQLILRGLGWVFLIVVAAASTLCIFFNTFLPHSFVYNALLQHFSTTPLLSTTTPLPPLRKHTWHEINTTKHRHTKQNAMVQTQPSTTQSYVGFSALHNSDEKLWPPKTMALPWQQTYQELWMKDIVYNICRVKRTPRYQIQCADWEHTLDGCGGLLSLCQNWRTELYPNSRLSTINPSLRIRETFLRYTGDRAHNDVPLMWLLECQPINREKLKHWGLLMVWSPCTSYQPFGQQKYPNSGHSCHFVSFPCPGQDVNFRILHQQLWTVYWGYDRRGTLHLN